VLYYLADPKAAGFKRNSGNANGPMTDEQKTERKELIANNKHGHRPKLSAANG
jgi:ParB family chromosome partitioning protein